MGITLSAGVRRALGTLQTSSLETGKVQNRLASGLRVSSALDGPSNYFTASSLRTRGAGLSTLLDSMQQAIMTLKAADEGIKSINKLVENAQSLAKQAEAAGPDSAAVAATTATFTGGNIATTGSMSDTDTITLRVNGTEINVTFNSTEDTGTEYVSKLNTALGANGNAALSGTTQITISAETAGANRIEVVTGTTTALNRLGLSTSNSATGTAAVAAVTKRRDLAAEYNAVLQQVSEQAADAGYNGVNLLMGDNLDVTFNETGSSRLQIRGTQGNTQGLALTSASGNWSNNTQIAEATNALKRASDSLRAKATAFGTNLSVVQNRQSFSKEMIRTLNEGADALTAADLNEEGANLLALQTRSALAQNSLRMAATDEQSILNLVR